MRGARCVVLGFAACLCSIIFQTASAQQEVYHPGETYDTLQAGLDTYGDSEAERRAKIGRQLLIEQEVMRLGTWADPQARYRPVNPESYGPVTPQVYIGPTLADVYANTQRRTANFGDKAGRLPLFEPWPRVPNDIYGTPYYGYVRQPIGYVKIWTGRLSYISKPVYASPAFEPSRPAVAITPPTAISLPPRPKVELARPVTPIPPPPAPAVPPVGNRNAKENGGRDAAQPKGGQEI